MATRQCSNTPSVSTSWKRPPWPSWKCPRPVCKQALDGLPAEQREALQAGGGAGARLPREAADAFVELHRGRRHHAGPAGHAAGSRRPVRAGRQGGLSVIGADERDSGQGGRRGRTDHGGADAGRRGQSNWCWPRPRCAAAWTACSPSAARRRWARWPTAPQTVPQVDKIVGPGNAYVAAAKRRVFGVVGIDMMAGPSEILMICDGQTDPGLDRDGPVFPGRARRTGAIHPAVAGCRLYRCGRGQHRQAAAEMPRQEIIRTALENRGALIQVTRPGRGGGNRQLHFARSTWSCRSKTRTRCCRRSAMPARSSWARQTCEALGDYCAGPEPRAADLAHRALLLAAGRVRLPEAQQPDQVSQAGAQTLGKIAADAGLRRGSAGARPFRRIPPGTVNEPAMP